MNKSIIAIAMVGSLAVSLSAFANKGADYKGSSASNGDWSKNWYVGGGVNGNASNTQDKHTIQYIPVVPLDFELDETDVGFDIFVGKNINKHWAAEMGFTQVGDTTFEAEFVDTINLAQLEVTQWNIHLVGIYKLNVADHFNLFGKFGAAYFASTQTVSYDTDDDENGYEFSVEDTVGTMALTYGFGAEVTWDKWGIRGEYNVIAPPQDISDSLLGTFYVADVISLNGYYKFSY